METLDLVRSLLLITHILGLSLILGSFFLQMRRKKSFEFGTMLIGAITQLVTGLALVGVLQAGRRRREQREDRSEDGLCRCCTRRRVGCSSTSGQGAGERRQREGGATVPAPRGHGRAHQRIRRGALALGNSDQQPRTRRLRAGASVGLRKSPSAAQHIQPLGCPRQPRPCAEAGGHAANR